MRFVIKDVDLKLSTNSAVKKLFNADLQTFNFPSTFESAADLPAFIRDFQKRSVLLEGKNVDQYLDEDFPEAKEQFQPELEQDFFEKNKAACAQFLKNLYEQSFLKDCNFPENDWVQKRKERLSLNVVNLSGIDDFKEIYGLLVLDKVLRTHFPGSAENYLLALNKILKNYSQLISTLINNVYTNEAAFFKGDVVADITFDSEKIYVNCDLQKPVTESLDARLSRSSGSEDYIIPEPLPLQPISWKTELTENSAQLMEIQTMDPIHWYVAMGYSSNDLDYANYLAGLLDAGVLRLKIVDFMDLAKKLDKLERASTRQYPIGENQLDNAFASFKNNELSKFGKELAVTIKAHYLNLLAEKNKINDPIKMARIDAEIFELSKVLDSAAECFEENTVEGFVQKRQVYIQNSEKLFSNKTRDEKIALGSASKTSDKVKAAVLMFLGALTLTVLAIGIMGIVAVTKGAAIGVGAVMVALQTPIAATVMTATGSALSSLFLTFGFKKGYEAFLGKTGVAKASSNFSQSLNIKEIHKLQEAEPNNQEQTLVPGL